MDLTARFKNHSGQSIAGEVLPNKRMKLRVLKRHDFPEPASVCGRVTDEVRVKMLVARVTHD